MVLSIINPSGAGLNFQRTRLDLFLDDIPPYDSQSSRSEVEGLSWLLSVSWWCPVLDINLGPPEARLAYHMFIPIFHCLRSGTLGGVCFLQPHNPAAPLAYNSPHVRSVERKGKKNLPLVCLQDCQSFAVSQLATSPDVIKTFNFPGKVYQHGPSTAVNKDPRAPRREGRKPEGRVE